MSISVFFPCFNDQHTIGKLVEDAIHTVKKITKRFEIIVVDDGSTDGSRQILLSLAKKCKNLKLIFHQKNLGYGGALQSGFRKAQYNLIFYTDGDGQYDVKELPLLAALMTADVSFVNGIKMERSDPTYRIVLGNVYSFAARWMFWLPIHDIDCDFRLIRKGLISKIKLQCKSGAVCIELVKKCERAGARFREVSIHHRDRSFGQSQFFRPKHLLKTFRELLSLWFNLMVTHAS